MTKPRMAKMCLLLWLLLLTACSSTTFIYNRLDFLLPWYLGGYVDLNRDQKKNLDEMLQPFLGWHRQEELPRYLDMIEQLDRSLDKPLERQDIDELVPAFEEAWERLENAGLEWMLQLGAELSAQQLADFSQKLREQQLEYEEEYLTRDDEEYREDTYDGLLDSFQDYLGRLDSQQKQVLRETSAAMLRSDGMWLEARALWLVKFEALLQREPGWQQRIREAIATRNESNPPQYQAIFEHNVEQIQLAMISIVNGRTEKQNRRLRRKLNNFREDLQTLIEQGST